MSDTNKIGVKYRIEVTFDDVKYTDVQYFVVIKAPIVKQANITLMRINLPISVALVLKHAVSLNRFPNIRVKIFSSSTPDGEEWNESHDELVVDRLYTILSINEQESIHARAPITSVILVLSDPIVYSMSTASFNKILTQTTAYDAVLAYESYIDETRGKRFYNHVATSEQLNEFQYEQIFIPSTVDLLNVPKYIINTYKTHHSYSMYFIDDFDLTASDKYPITHHWINFASIRDMFDKMNVLQYIDVKTCAYRIKSYSLTDINRLLDGSTLSTTFRFRDMTVDFLKETEDSYGQHIVNNSDVLKMIDIDASVISSSVQSQSLPSTTKARTIYIPDNKDNALARWEQIKTLYYKEFSSLTLYEIERTFPSFVKFGYLYNLDEEAPDEYVYTPISIVIIFRRTHQKSSTVFQYCWIKALFISLYHSFV